MAKGTVLLLTDSPLEKQIIASFFEAAGLTVIESATVLHVDHPQVLPRVDAAVLALEDRSSGLNEICSKIRKAVDEPDLPVLAILRKEPTSPSPGVHVFLRPIRLFELVDRVNRILAQERIPLMRWNRT